jgi:hypothetical protein
VDLGLPSGLLWATCNIGAKEPWESGLYFSWGNVYGHRKEPGYYFCEHDYETTPGGKLTTDIPADIEYDAARANFGGSWRMPTASEFQELRNICISEWVTQDGVNGRLFTSRINGNSVFFPATGLCIESTTFNDGMSGYYWSSSFNSYTNSRIMFLNSYDLFTGSFVDRFIGISIRPVLDRPKNSLLIKTIKR